LCFNKEKEKRKEKEKYIKRKRKEKRKRNVVLKNNQKFALRKMSNQNQI